MIMLEKSVMLEKRAVASEPQGEVGVGGRIDEHEGSVVQGS